MRMAVFLALLVAMGARQAAAQPLAADRLTPPLATREARHIADVASWVTVFADLALDTKASWDAPHRRRAFGLQGVRLGVTLGVAQVVKQLVGRTRPCATEPEACGGDAADASFYSLHTAFAFQALGGPHLTLVVPLAIGTGGLRIAAGKHWLTDTAAGALAGYAAGRWIR